MKGGSDVDMELDRVRAEYARALREHAGEQQLTLESAERCLSSRPPPPPDSDRLTMVLDLLPVG
jgi:hypothetical protein